MNPATSQVFLRQTAKRVLYGARSARSRAMPLRVPGRRPSSARRSGSSSCGNGSSPRLDPEIASSEIVLSPGLSASTPRTRSTATSRRAAVALIGAGRVRARVTDRRSAKRTRTVTVRQGRPFARMRLAMRSARCCRTGRNTRSVAGWRPSADWAPTEWARRPVWIGRAPRHAAPHPERSRFIGRREHDPAPNRDRPAPQGRLEQLLDRRVHGAMFIFCSDTVKRRSRCDAHLKRT